MNIHEKIKLLRLRAGWTQQELADRAGVTHKSACSWEHSSRPRGLKLMKLCELFGIDQEILINDSLDIPTWEPAEKVKSIYSPDFSKHLSQLKEETEAHLINESKVDIVIRLAEQAEQSLHTLLIELKSLKDTRDGTKRD